MPTKKKNNPTPDSSPDLVEMSIEMAGLDAPIEICVTPDVADVMGKLQTERDEAVNARQRALADFANYQRRALENERRARVDGTSAVVRALLPVLDNFDLALNQNAETLTVDQLVAGVDIVRSEFTRVLAAHGVERIEPAPGDEFDPTRHEAMMRQPAEDIAPDHVVSVFQAGYALGDTVVRPAKVVLAAPHAE